MPRRCLVVLSSCTSLIMPPKSKERKKVARVVPAKAKKEGGLSVVELELCDGEIERGEA